MKITDNVTDPVPTLKQIDAWKIMLANVEMTVLREELRKRIEANKAELVSAPDNLQPNTNKKMAPQTKAF